MSRLSLQKMFLMAAGLLSLLAQGFLLLPESFGSTQKSFLPWGSLAAGATLFVFAMFLFLSVIGRQFAQRPSEWRVNGILLLTQALTAIGIYLLLEGFAARERGAGFLLSSLVTALTSYGIFRNTIYGRAPQPLSNQEEGDPSAAFQ